MTDSVNRPAHYNVGEIEVIDAIEAWGFGEGFNRGNAIKYIARAGHKDKAAEIEDLQKAYWYIAREIKRLQDIRLDMLEIDKTGDVVDEPLFKKTDL